MFNGSEAMIFQPSKK